MSNLYEAECIAGLSEIAAQEIKSFIKPQGNIIASEDESITFTYNGDWHDLLQFRSVIAVYTVQRFPIPRPKGLLGHEHKVRWLGQVKHIIDSDDAYRTFYISAAGSSSSVMQRIKDAIASETSLTDGDTVGDLWIRIRPTEKIPESWDFLTRLSARPLATRDYRVCNLQGALNGSAAYAIMQLTAPTPDDVFLNIACGSGTIMIERAQYMTTQRIIGVDIERDAIACARENIQAANLLGAIELIQSDARYLDLEDGSVDALCADLPFGQLVGSHDENVTLYPAILSEAARVAKRHAQFVVLTHEVRLMQDILKKQTEWHFKRELPITLSGLHPRLYVLERL